MNPRRRRIIPPPGGQLSEEGVAGPPTYHMPMSGKVTRVVPVPMDEWQIGEAGPPMNAEQARAWRESRGVLDPDRPLIPTADEVAKLPRTARAALAARCAARVAPLTGPGAPPALDPGAAAALIVSAAAVRTPLARHLRCIRRDFDRLAYLARKHSWADDTPVPPDVFGPMWPVGPAPAWAGGPPAG